MRHGQCWRAVEAALHARKICEAADVTINAALAKCIAQEMRLRDAIIAKAPYMRSGIQSIVDSFRDGGRPLMLLAILAKRFELGHCANVRPNSNLDATEHARSVAGNPTVCYLLRPSKFHLGSVGLEHNCLDMRRTARGSVVPTRRVGERSMIRSLLRFRKGLS